MANLRQVRISGFGGQGVVLAGTILGYAAIRDGKWVAGSSSYGAQARGGSARSDVIISEGPIVYPHVIEADVLVTLAQTAYTKYTDELARGAWVIYDNELVSPKAIAQATQIGVPATASAIRELKQQQAANIVMLGTLAAVTAIASKEALRSAVEENVSERFRELNLEALEVGYRLVKASKQ